MVIYGRDDINILKHFNEAVPWDVKIVLLRKDNNIPVGPSLCWYVNGAQTRNVVAFARWAAAVARLSYA